MTAVEPTPELRDGARVLYGHLPTSWLDDSLPFLGRLTFARPSPFAFILVEGVWAHLTANERMDALPILAGLLSEGGVIAMSLRHGPPAQGRITFPVTAAETADLAEAAGLSTLVNVETGSIQAANIANGVTWTRMAFGKPS